MSWSFNVCLDAEHSLRQYIFNTSAAEVFYNPVHVHSVKSMQPQICTLSLKYMHNFTTKCVKTNSIAAAAHCLAERLITLTTAKK